MSRALVFAIAFFAVFASSATGAEKRPVLILSRTSGGAGTRVSVIAQGCTKPVGQPDTLAWHDHYYWMHDIQKQPPMDVWRSIRVTRMSPTTAHAIFVVRRADHLGRGLLDMFCGGNGNATATFLVTS